MSQDFDASSVDKSVQITVLYFAAAQTETNLFSEAIPLPITSSGSGSTNSETDSKAGGFPLADLAALLSARHRATELESVLETCAWSLNEEMVPEEDVASVRLKAGDVVAVIPPVSGG